MPPARVLLLLGPVLLAGCTSPTVDDALTGDEARQRVVAVAADAAQVLPLGASWQLQRAGDAFRDVDPLGPTGCRPAGFPDADPVAVEARWGSTRTVADPAAVRSALEARWEAQGHGVTRPDATSSRTTVDGVVATVTVYRGSVGIAVVSPCFHPGDRPGDVTLPTRLPTPG